MLKQILFRLMPVGVMISLLLPISTVMALSSDAYDSLYGDTVWYDPSSGACATSSSSLAGSDNEEKTWNYFKSKGLSDKQVAGIMGNLQQESSFNPEIMQIGGTSKNPADGDPLGWGLAQWTPGSKILGIAQSLKIKAPIYELSTQLDIIWAEMQGVSPTGVKAMVNGLKEINDEQEAAIYFDKNFEGGTDPGGVREKNATNILKKYGGSGDNTMGNASRSLNSCSASLPSGPCKVTKPVYEAQYSQDQLTKIFGDPGSASKPGLALVTVKFLDRNARVSPLVAPCLEAVSQQIQSEKINYTIRLFGCYRFDSDNGSSNIGLKSYHTYGAACDINWDTNPWSGDGSPKKYDMPQAYIQAFNDRGFTWGGNWNSVKDYMHFEWHGVIP